ncbi:alkyldihydroxyacetonephosphate synthase [Angustibacter sp. Root456]|nr:alkyldihydroxyacetonephosphate synthase [Angustibacter sp. Root456]
MPFARWGAIDHATPLTPQARALVRQALGIEHPPAAATTLRDVGLPRPQLPSGFLSDLRELLGPGGVATDDASRALHARGRSTSDLLRLRAGDLGDAPDAVLRPGTAEQVQAALARCGAARVAVVPFGGGTSVVGGLSARRDGFAGLVALDLRGLRRLVALDTVSRTAELEAGLLGPEAEALLAAEGFTLGHFPQSFEHASIGGFAATRSSGQASAGYGRFDDLVVALRAATPRGPLELGRAPASAAGPDLRQLLLGSEGAFGVITSVTVRVRPAPQASRYEGWRFATFPDAVTAARALAQDGPLPTVLRVSDEAETAIGLATPESVGAEFGSGALLVAGYEGTAADVERRAADVATVLTTLGGTCLGPEPGEAWRRGRYAGGYLRDALLDEGALVETLETAAFWSQLPVLYDAVRGALADALGRSIVLCHLSHVYATGGSLYFTVAAPQTHDPLRQWDCAKRAASEAVLSSGGTISHHHGIGRDHRDDLPREIGDVGVGVLRAVKDYLDPDGVLNPGALVGEGT